MRDLRQSRRLKIVNGSNPYGPADIGHAPRRRHSCDPVQWLLSPHPSPLPWGEYVFSAPINNGRGAAFRPLHGPHFPGARGNPQRHSECATLKRRKRRAPFARASPTLNRYWEEGELDPTRSTIQTLRLCTARCAPFPLPEGQGEGKRRGNDPASRTIPRTVELGEFSGIAGSFS